MTRTLTDPEPLLTADDEERLAATIEAGVLAGGMLVGRCAHDPGHLGRLGPPGRSEPTESELRLLEAEGRRAWLRFVQANLGLVRIFAVREARRCQLPEAELFQEGCLALMLALQRYDHRRGVRFSTYAVPWIRAAVGLAGARRCGEVDLPAWRAGALRRARAAESWLAVDLGRMPSPTEIGVAMDRGSGWVEGLLAHRPAQPIDHDERPPDLADAVGELELERVLTAGSGSRLLNRLSELEQRVIAVRFGFADGRPHSIREAAGLLGMGRKALRAVEERALQRLRRELSRSAAA